MTPSLTSLPIDSAELLATAKSLTASTAHLHFSIASQSHDAISFEGTEAISTPFSATLYVLAEPDSAWLGRGGLETP